MSICAIVNPKAGGWSKQPDAAREEPGKLVARWLRADERVTPDQILVRVLTRPEESAAWAREAVEAGYKTIVAVGGDGTINAVMQGILGAGTQSAPSPIALGILPMGTANVLARVLNVPLNDPQQAATVITVGQTRCIDVGRAGTRWFALMAGIGFDGAATQGVSVGLKRRVGELAYIWSALQVSQRYPRTLLYLALDDDAPQIHDAYLVSVANSPLYGGRFRLGPSIHIDDGWLDVYVCLRRGPLPLCALRHGLALLRDRFETASGVLHFRAQRLTIDADSPLCIQLDGEVAGSTPLQIEIVPGALNVCVP